MAKDTIHRARIRLLMSSGDSVTSGAAGEAAAIVMFESLKLMWMRVDQSPASYSAELIEAGAKRPDFLAWEGAEPFFIDVKTYTPTVVSPGIWRFSLEDEEWRRLDATESATRIAVAVLFWDKSHYGKYRYALCALPDASIRSHAGKTWRDFNVLESEFLSLKPSP